MSLFWLIAIPVGGTILSFIAGYQYIKYCDEYSARQWIKDAYLLGVKPAPSRFRDMWRRFWRDDQSLQRIRVDMGKVRKIPCHEVHDEQAPLSIEAQQYLTELRNASSIVRLNRDIPQQRTGGTSPAPMISLPIDSCDEDLSKPAPNIWFSESTIEPRTTESPSTLSPIGSMSNEPGASDLAKPEVVYEEWPYR